MPFGLESQYHLNAVVKLYLSQTAFNLKFTGRNKIRTHQNKSATQQDSQVLLLILREPWSIISLLQTAQEEKKKKEDT